MSGISNPAPLTPTGGRLTLVSGLPVSISDQTAKTRVYFTPYAGSGNGDRVVLYDAAGFPQVVEFSEVFIDLTNAQTGTRASTGNAIISGLTDTSQLIAGMEISGTGIGAASVISTIDSATQVTGTVNNTATGTATVTFKLPASKNVDIYAVASQSTIALRFSALWSGNTTRAEAIALNRGAYTKSGDTTRLYLGTVRTTATAGQTEDSDAARYVWSFYHRVLKKVFKNTIASHTYTTAAWRQWNGGSTEVVPFVTGIGGEATFGTVRHGVTGSNLTTNYCGMGYDGSVIFGSNALGTPYSDTIALNGVSLFSSPGYHYWEPYEFGAVGSVVTFDNYELTVMYSA